MSHPRRDYEKGALVEVDMAEDPLVQFRRWFDEAVASELLDEPYAMNVATVDVDGRPHARIVLMRDLRDGGFVFFTNYDGAKGRELAENNAVALTFYWGPLERQIRIEGTAEKIAEAESDAYFASRPHKSKLGALVSRQSSVIGDRSELEDEMQALLKRYPDGSDVPRPQHWGGYIVKPEMVEFWQGRRSRLHDRLRYRSTVSGWVLERLAP